MKFSCTPRTTGKNGCVSTLVIVEVIHKMPCSITRSNLARELDLNDELIIVGLGRMLERWIHWTFGLAYNELARRMKTAFGVNILAPNCSEDVYELKYFSFLVSCVFTV